MTASTRDAGFIRYFCTAGHGMERFLSDEVKTKLGAKHVSQIPGKVLFSSSAGIEQLTELKAAERLFLLVKQDSPAAAAPERAVSVLQSRLFADRSQWTRALRTWSCLQGALDRRKATGVPGGPDWSVKKREEEEKKKNYHVQTGGRTGEQKEDGENTDQRKRRAEKQERLPERELEEQEPALAKRRKTEDELDESRNTASASSHEKNVVNINKSEDGRTGDAPGEEPDVRSGSSTAGAEQRPGNGTRPEREDEKLLAHSTGEPQLPSSVSFRISCRCTGSLSRCSGSQELSKVIGVGLSRLLGWKVDLKNPQLEITVYLSDDHNLLGIPLTRTPLANRSYIKTTGLRSTVAWAMASLAPIQPGFCVVDPMCGVGTILVEAAQEHKTARFLGVDADDGQLQKARTNVEFAELGNRIHLLRASSMALPLPSASVDAVICDLPFGRKFGTRVHMEAKLPLIVTEMERVLRPGGTMVLLLSPQLSCLLKKLLSQSGNGSTADHKTKPQTRTRDCPPLSSTKLQTPQNQQGVKSSSTEEPDPPRLSSLRHEASLRVSLGVIDGLIHKYVKIDQPKSHNY